MNDKNCTEQSQPKMSINQIKFKIQCSFRTSFPNYTQENFSKTTKAGHIMHKQVSGLHAKIRIYYNHKKPYLVFLKLIL